jgi:hypothetical protein
MGVQRFYNNAQAQLQSSINSVVTTITVGGGEVALFPDELVDGDWFLLTLSDNTLLNNVRETVWEIVKVTAVADAGGGNLNLTVVRGQEGTTAVGWASGLLASIRTTAATLDSAFSEPSFDRILTDGDYVLLDGSGNVLYSN